MGYKGLIVSTVRNSFALTLIVAVFLLGLFLTFEPVVSRAVTDIFTVSQSITAEISFVASTTDVTMSPSIAGLTGGTAHGSTTIRVDTI
jgi:hypothetical protein